MKGEATGPRLVGKVLAAFVAFGLSYSPALAESVDVTDGAMSADTSEFGQASEFSNITTVFDKVEFNVQRLIRDPKEKSNLRLIGQLVNGNSDVRWVQLFFPHPKLTDELGNEYLVKMWTGVDACRYREKEKYNWRDETTDCPESGLSTLLAPGLPVTVSITFEPSDKGTFDRDLASVATYLNATLSFILAPSDPSTMSYTEKKETIVPYSVVIPQMPIPAAQ
jgi:hypothetical protein